MRLKGKDPHIGKYVLNSQQSIILGHTFAPRWGTCLDLAYPEGNDEIRDDGVLGLTTTVGDHYSPTVGL
jgi:hypothetical protein